MLDSLFSWLLLPLGIALGWVLARKSPAGHGAAPIDSAQLGGLLSRLASDDPDQAIAALTQVAEIDVSTAELHLTLGSLFRKRGEVDRALRIHEALLARPQLDPGLQQQTRYELAQDYMKAGLIDRAEALYEELAAQGRYGAEALGQLLAIAEQGRDWRHAIEIGRRIESSKGESKRALIAQYFCELAEEARRAQQPDEAVKLARRALDEQADCVRANLLLGQLHEAAQDHPAAIKAYRKALEQDPRFLAELLEPLHRCYQQTGDKDGYMQFLRDAKELSPSSLPLVAEARLLREAGVEVIDHLAHGLETRPSRAVLAEFLEQMESRPDVIAAGLAQPAASLRKTIRKLMDTAPRYQCSNCGFAPRQLFWQCPTCKQWGTTMPVDDILKA